MRVAVLGQGSIGRRHAQIALELGHEVAAYDPLGPPAILPGAKPADSADECLEGAGAAVIASPSSEHAAQARAAIEQGVPVLVEKPLALDWARAAELDWLARERGVLLSVAMNLREHPGVLAVSRALAEGGIGSVLRASAWCGSWLPGWRAGGDYRESYSAHCELGGGALLDVAVHELDYLLWLLGPARSVSALARRVSDLQIDVEDVALIALELDGGAVAEVSVDYLDRSYTRGCRIVGSQGTLHWSWESDLLCRYDAAGAIHRQPVPSDVAPTYCAQLERFLDAVKQGAEAPVPASDALQALAVIDAARASSREGRRIALPAPLTLRAAGLEDSERLLAWRNDPATRRWSRDSRPVTRRQHARWLPATLGDVTTRLWIAESEGAPVGQVRVGPRSGGVAELHITLAPTARGRGLGSSLLVQVTASALADPGTERLCAYVNPDNVASLRAFARAGFGAAGTAADGYVRLERAPARAPGPQ
jgi:predicted dehydrogenase/RimJ/RimL family protein N-acetyltransferase